MSGYFERHLFFCTNDRGSGASVVVVSGATVVVVVTATVVAGAASAAGSVSSPSPISASEAGVVPPPHALTSSEIDRAAPRMLRTRRCTCVTLGVAARPAQTGSPADQPTTVTGAPSGTCSARKVTASSGIRMHPLDLTDGSFSWPSCRVT